MEKYLFFYTGDSGWRVECCEDGGEVANGLCNNGITKIFGKQQKSFILDVSDDKFTRSTEVYCEKSEKEEDTFQKVSVKVWHPGPWAECNYTLSTYYQKVPGKSKIILKIGGKTENKYSEEILRIFEELWGELEEGENMIFYWKVREIS